MRRYVSVRDTTIYAEPQPPNSHHEKVLSVRDTSIYLEPTHHLTNSHHEKISVHDEVGFLRQAPEEVVGRRDPVLRLLELQDLQTTTNNNNNINNNNTHAQRSGEKRPSAGWVGRFTTRLGRNANPRHAGCRAATLFQGEATSSRDGRGASFLLISGGLKIRKYEL